MEISKKRENTEKVKFSFIESIYTVLMCIDLVIMLIIGSGVAFFILLFIVLLMFT